jgi:CRISPR-associated protein (Cas_Cas02710)
MPRALLLTVGTGDAANLEASLFVPLMQSIATGEWTRIVLLPSQVTGAIAERLGQRLQAATITVAPLPKRDTESDLDACFDHFDRIIETLLTEGFDPTELVADFTRGTKVMGAALVLAAVRHGVPILRYVGGAQRDQRGVVVAGTERISETRTARATARRRIDLARGLVDHAAFGAALTLLPDPDNTLAAIGWDAGERDALRALRPLVAWLAAWDRLDYAGAAAVIPPQVDALPAAWRRNWPPTVVTRLVARLSTWPRSNRLIAVDLLANAERRVAQGQYEDALVRVYNVVERIARARLHDVGLIAGGRDDSITALQQRSDPMADMLRNLDSAHPSLRTAARNDSILIHGLAAQGSASYDDWTRLLASIETLLRRDAALRNDTAGLERDLAAARFPQTWSTI